MSPPDRQIPANDARVIAPCGIDCSLCRAYIRERNRCPGCRSEDVARIPGGCLRCVLRSCDRRPADGPGFCSSCDEYPCRALQHLEHRYTTRYAVSPLENLERIASVGVDRFVAEESLRWTCPGCGGHLCMHKPACPRCGRPWRDG